MFYLELTKLCGLHAIRSLLNSNSGIQKAFPVQNSAQHCQLIITIVYDSVSMY